jgi:hypothetical protein
MMKHNNDLYPREPASLNWQEHYEMSDQVFHACVQAVKGRVPLPSIRAEAHGPHGQFKQPFHGKRIA